MSDDKRTIDRFLAYLRIKSVHPTPDYASANAFLSEYLASFGFEPRLIALPSGLSVLLATMKGRDSSLPSLLLTSHCDVVPVEEKSWKFDPFAAHVDTDGKIYGRGAQDMKSCTVQHIEALGRLKRSGASFLRDIHVRALLCARAHSHTLARSLARATQILIAPDEEIGGNRGIRSFLPMDEFKKLNVGVALDEGLANPRDAYTLFYGERTPWWVKITASGNVGHGSRFIEGAAVDKLHAVCHKFLEFRAQQKAQYDSATVNCVCLSLRRLAFDWRGVCQECGCKTLGDFTTVNLTNIKAGIGQINVVPASGSSRRLGLVFAHTTPHHRSSLGSRGDV